MNNALALKIYNILKGNYLTLEAFFKIRHILQDSPYVHNLKGLLFSTKCDRLSSNLLCKKITRFFIFFFIGKREGRNSAFMSQILKVSTCEWRTCFLSWRRGEEAHPHFHISAKVPAHSMQKGLKSWNVTNNDNVDFIKIPK